MAPSGGTDQIVRYADKHEETSLVQYHVRYRNRTQIAEAYGVDGFVTNYNVTKGLMIAPANQFN